MDAAEARSLSRTNADRINKELEEKRKNAAASVLDLILKISIPTACQQGKFFIIKYDIPTWTKELIRPKLEAKGFNWENSSSESIKISWT